MIEEKSLSPPIGAVMSYDQLLNVLESRSIPRVDKEFLESYQIASGNESKIISGLKFLGLIDTDGNAKEAMNSLCDVPTKRKENLEKIVRKAYTLLFDFVKIDLKKADSDTLLSAFKNDYHMSSMNTATRAAKVFTYLADKSGIPISESIRSGLLANVDNEKKPSKGENKSARKPKKIPEKKYDKNNELPTETIARLELKGTGHVDIKNIDDYEIAKAYWNLLKKKLGITD
jgi:hypothetical protein